MILNGTMPTSQRQSICFSIFSDSQVFHRFSSSVTMSVVYDYEPSARDDPLVPLVVNAMEAGVAMMTPERAVMLKIFPFRECLILPMRFMGRINILFAVLNLPDWCPGSSIKRDAQIAKKLTNEMVDVPFEYVKQHMVRSTHFVIITTLSIPCS
jgi:hypothetical protein